MMMYNVFISHSGEDQKFVEVLFNSLKRIDKINPFVATYYRESGQVLKGKIARELDCSTFVIALLTSAGTISQWVNQEIGYAYAKGKTIIPVKDQSVELTGFLADREYTNFEINSEDTIANIIYDLEIHILNTYQEQLTFELTCPFCTKMVKYYKKKVKCHLHIDTISDAIKQGGSLVYRCDVCGSNLTCNPKTLEQIELEKV